MDRVRLLSLLASGLLLVACHLTPAQVKGGISLACTATVVFTPASASPSVRAVEAEICKGTALAEADIQAAIVDAIADASVLTAGPTAGAPLRAVAPAAMNAPSSTSSAPVALTCAGTAIAALTAPPAVAAHAQARLDVRAECGR